jgi:uncharacterized protein (TIGR03435 family)
LSCCIVSLIACAPPTASCRQVGGRTNGDGDQHQFEVATIKPHTGDESVINMGGGRQRYESTNVSLKLLVELAYGLPEDQVSGGPAWVESKRFDISAKIADADWEEMQKLGHLQQAERLRPMLQSLLRDRMQVVIAHQPKRLGVYALVVGKGGSKLRPVGSPELPPSGVHSFMMVMMQKDIPVAILAQFLENHFHRTVLDKTGLTGMYDIDFKVSLPDRGAGEDEESVVLRALEDQLGLKIESRKEVVDTVVIEKAELPSEN